LRQGSAGVAAGASVRRGRSGRVCRV
jgi:hypothetical protein